MTEKQNRFIDEFMLDLNATQAAIRAGYSPKSARFQASKMLLNVDIADTLSNRQGERAKRAKVDADWVLVALKSNHEGAQAKGEYGHSNKALELLGKHIGFFDKYANQDSSVNISITTPPRPASDYTDDELAMIIQQA